ncbi:LmeA family phospholipid-binding protein [Streptomyces jumonjinensis]|uniref:LmeA family phospholipid-binding protein n=1 Tax=Streptomyces jumonjinensis TaxID=1945 RepID=UPI0018869F63|nr:DUF2993 domain-containing protein [Streptomyces jumonjinensis]
MRALRITLIIAVILGVVFTALDRIAVNFAESEAAEKIRTSQGLSSAPEVSINGFPFLTQVVGKQLDDVDISLSGVAALAGERVVRVSEVRAELSEVTIDSGYTSAVAARAEGSARISYEDLAQAAPEGAVVGYAGPERAAKNQVKVTGPLVKMLEGAGLRLPDTASALLGDRTVTAYSTVEIAGGDAVRLKAESLPELPVPGFDADLRRAMDYELDIEGIPVSLRLNQVTADEKGLKVMGTGQGVTLVG